MEKVVAIIVAGGKGTRMGLDVKKQYLLLEGKEILAHTIEKFQHMDEIDEIVVVVSKEDIEFVKNKICNSYHFTKVKKVVSGGKERQDSVKEGLKSIEKADYILIHDGARPFIKKQIIKEAIQKVKQQKACIVGVKVKDTMKVCDPTSQKVINTPDRESLWIVQTPQIFERQLLEEAYSYALEHKIIATDDSSLVEKMGKSVSIIEGDYTNIKITTKEDLLFAKAILASEKK